MQEEKEAYVRPYGVTVTLQPQNETFKVKARSVQQLLNIVKTPPATALVIRGETELLTPDRKLSHGDNIIVRTVVSSG